MKAFFKPCPRVLAHRGDSLNFPENTEAAFRSALEKGADVLETDLRLSADGRPVLSHDSDFRRLCGDSRPISSLRAAEIKKLDAGFLFGPESSYPFRNRGLCPLLLEEVLELFPGTRFNLDLKAEDPALAESTAQILRNAGAVERVCVASFHHRVLKTFREFLPEAATSLSKREMIQLLLFRRLRVLPAAVRNRKAVVLQIPEYAGRIRLLSPSLIRWCRKRRLILQVWTVNSPGKMKTLLEEGVDGIFTDDPEGLSRICARMSL